jgi:hypothetical protein
LIIDEHVDYAPEQAVWNSVVMWFNSGEHRLLCSGTNHSNIWSIAHEFICEFLFYFYQIWQNETKWGFSCVEPNILPIIGYFKLQFFPSQPHSNSFWKSYFTKQNFFGGFSKQIIVIEFVCIVFGSDDDKNRFWFEPLYQKDLPPCQQKIFNQLQHTWKSFISKLKSFVVTLLSNLFNLCVTNMQLMVL